MVLFVSISRKLAIDAANLFKRLQIVAYGTTQIEALSEISPLYHAVVLIDPERFPDHIDFIKKIHSYHRDIPVFALTDRPDRLPHPELFGVIESNDVRSADFATKILKYAHKHSIPPIGIYRTGGLESICYKPYMTFYDMRLDFSKTEAKIIRYLMATYPFPQNAETIIKHVYPHGKRPDPCTIRTHVCAINRKFHIPFPWIDFIIHIPRQGYKFRHGKIIGM